MVYPCKRSEQIRKSLATTQAVIFLLCIIFSLSTAYGAKTPQPPAIHFELTLKSESFGNMGVRKMWLKGNKMRWESKSDRLPIRLIKNDKGVFLIHPWNKIAAKYSEGTNRGNPKALFPGPLGPVNVFLKNVKAYQTGWEILDKRKCNVYSYKDPLSGRGCKIWVDTKSGKPAQLILKGITGKADTVIAKYTKFEVGTKVSDSLFELPKGYAIKPMPAPRVSSSKKTNDQKEGKKSG